MFKKLLSTALCTIMFLGMTTTAFANDQEAQEILINVDPETNVTVVIPSEYANQFDLSEIQDIIENQHLNDGDRVIIHEVKEVSDSTNDVQPLFGYTYKTTKTSGSEWKAQDYFVISAAKGQTTTLSSKFSQTITTKFTVGDPFVKADIGGSVTAEYSVTHKFVGPPETSSYNSREFRVQFYAKTVTWTQKKINSSNVVVDTKTGKADVPTKYALYSIDRKI